MNTQNVGVQEPATNMTLKPGVNLQSKGFLLQGPEMDRENRMTLEEYYLY